MDRRLPIRLSIVEGESLSGYIIRSARAMNVSCKDLLKYMILNYNIHYKFKDNRINVSYSRVAANIDVFPFGMVKENNIRFIFNKSKREIENATFKNIFDILNINYEADTDPYQMYLNIELVKDLRRFCPLCLKENGIYKLMWQLKEIEICDIHKIKLVSHCGVCDFKQKYFSSALENYRCSNCNSLLWENTNMEELKGGKLNEQIIVYNNWRFLLKYENKLVKLIENYNFEQSLAITMLYIAQNQENIFCIKNINEFHKRTIGNIVRFINNRERGMKISLNGIRRITSNNSILLSSLPNIEVPISYIQSLIREVKKNLLEFKCLSPWCSFLGSNDKIDILGKCDSRSRGITKKFVCTKCHMRFGYNSINNTCEPLNKSLFNNIPKVKELLLKNKIQEEIIYTLNISRDLYTKVLAYLLLYNLVSKDIKDNKLIIIPADIKDKFKILIEKNCLSDKKARKIFGWSYFQFHYYYWLPEIQSFLVNKEISDGVRIGHNIPKIKDWKKELLIAIDYFWEKNIDISYENIKKYFQISWNTLNKYQLSNIVKISIILQKSKRRLENDIDIIKKVTNYLDNSKYEIVSLKKLFTQTKINKYYIEKYHPNLKKNVVQKVSIHNSKIKEQELEYYKKEIRKIYLNSIEKGELETVSSISLKLGREHKFISRNPKLNIFTKKLLEHND